MFYACSFTVPTLPGQSQHIFYLEFMRQDLLHSVLGNIWALEVETIRGTTWLPLPWGCQLLLIRLKTYSTQVREHKCLDTQSPVHTICYGMCLNPIQIKYAFLSAATRASTLSMYNRTLLLQCIGQTFASACLLTCVMLLAIFLLLREREAELTTWSPVPNMADCLARLWWCFSHSEPSVTRRCWIFLHGNNILFSRLLQKHNR